MSTSQHVGGWWLVIVVVVVSWLFDLRTSIIPIYSRLGELDNICYFIYDSKFLSIVNTSQVWGQSVEQFKFNRSKMLFIFYTSGPPRLRPGGYRNLAKKYESQAKMEFRA